MLSFVRLPLPPPHICFRQHRFVCTSRLTHLATPQAFQSKTKFVVLSDLHVKRETLQTCLQALQITHDEAVKRNAAILFLGDFWHARGNLPVDPLNAVLTQLSTWKVPIIMIPGNHDLVSRTGNGVSLVPLATTLGSHRCLLITKPTVCLNALFLPYMHDTMALKSTLKEASTLPNKLNAIFCHAEVAGARLADRIVSPSDERTLNPQDFPSTTRVYSGHIHRPHTVSDSIRYVGSPYQVSAGEHDQHKMLLILDREQHWKVVDSVPIDIGSRHYTIRFNTPFTLPTLRRGDRVAIYAASPPHHFVDLLRDRGVRVELRSLPEDQTVQPEHDVAIASMEPRISPGAMSNTDLFREYAVIKRLPSNVTTASLNILHEIGGRPTSNISSKDVIIMWQSVTLRGFGTFFDSVTYPLQKRGLVMLTGRDCSHDDVLTGRTNATGKTTLIMAPLWAMTGRTDARPDGSVEKGVSLEMVHDDAKDCEVSVRLHLEGERALMEVFEMMTSTEREETGLVSTNGRRATQVLNVAVTRRSTRNGSLSNTRSYKQSLNLSVNGVDLSCLDVKETQNRIDRLVDGTLLPHTVFFGQHMGAGRGLLDSTDRTLKDHLALIFPLDFWKEARQKAKSKIAKLMEQQISSEASLEAARSIVTRLEEAVMSSQEQMDNFEAERSRKLFVIKSLTEEKFASSSYWEEDSVWFSETFAAMNTSDDLNRIIENTKQALNVLDERKKDRLDLARASAAAEMARAKAALSTDEALVNRVTVLIEKSRRWECDVERQLSYIKRCEMAVKDELDKLNTSKDIDGEWKRGIEALNYCDERLQKLVGSNIDYGNGKNSIVSSEQAKTIDTARNDLSVHQKESIRLQTLLQEVRQRLQQSEGMQELEQKSSLEDSQESRVPLNAVTCERCLRPFDGVMYLEARSKLESRAESIEEALGKVEKLERVAEKVYLSAVQTVGDYIETEKAKIVEEKRRFSLKLKGLRMCRDHRNDLLRDIGDLKKKRGGLERERNIYLEEVVALELVHESSAESASEIIRKICEGVNKRIACSRNKAMAAEKAYLNVISEIERKEEDERQGIQKKEVLQNLIYQLQGLHRECIAAENEANPYIESVRMLREELTREMGIARSRETEFLKVSENIKVMKQVDIGFGARGVASFILEEGLTWLEKATDKYLQVLSNGELKVQIRAFSDYKSSGKADGEYKEVISKRIFVRKQGGYGVRERSLRQLSGGQRRRCSMSFALAFADLARERAGFQSSLMVLDEILQSLDEDGRRQMARVIPQLIENKCGGRDCVVVVTQDEAPEISGVAHGGIDVVERQGDRSMLLMG